MHIKFRRYAAYQLHLPRGDLYDRRDVVLCESLFDGQLVLSLASRLYARNSAPEAAGWSFQHVASGRMSIALRRRLEAGIRSIPQVERPPALTPACRADQIDGEWLTQGLWSAFRRPSIVWLRVPYAARERAKRLGARWDAQARRWFGLRGAVGQQELRAWMPPDARH